MATQEEWRKIGYERELGKQGIKTGSMHNAAGYDQYKQAQSQKHGGGGGGAGCFTSETLVLTPSGWARIGAITRNQFVMTYDEGTGVLSARRVIERCDYDRRAIWALALDGRDKAISTTGSHSFLTSRGWRAANKLRTGDVVRDNHGSWQTVTSCRKTDRIAPVHNLVTEGNHTFIAEGCVVHNFTYFRMVRMIWYRLRGDRRTAMVVQPTSA
jgi:hypothetical protein